MKTNIHILPAVLIMLAGLIGLACPVTAQDNAPSEPTAYLPFVLQDGSASASIIIDHRHTDIRTIPAQWIEAAKQRSVHYAHTSHGSQILNGLVWLKDRDERYSVNIERSGQVIHPQAVDALNIYDGNNYPGDTYITPEMYWESDAGLSHTRSVVETGWFDISLWTWCGQMSSYSTDQVQQYLAALTQLRARNPNILFVLYTGHTDGSTPGSVLWRNNSLVRQHVNQNGGVLFDFADIESYDPDGNFFPNGSDACEWCADWCSANPNHFSCQSIPEGCEHTHGLQCTLKAQAFWSLMARLSGWDGSPTPP